jgi:methionyl aminopeptidase
MITIKSESSIKKMIVAGEKVATIMAGISQFMNPGINTLEIDSWIAQELIKNDLVSQTKGYHGYAHVSCISVNDEVVHGVPSASKVLASGDLVKVDICASWQGYCADMARCFFVEKAHSSAVEQLVRVAQQALDKGIEQAKPGNRVSDISAAIQREVEAYGYGIVIDFAGHGIGKQMHEDPEILNVGKPGRGPLLRPGMTFAIEPMITLGDYRVRITQDGWTVKTQDKSWAAHVEDTVLVGVDGPRVLTRFGAQGLEDGEHDRKLL